VGAPLRFVACGDIRFTSPARTSGTNPKVRKWLAEKIAGERPQALLLTGDMPYTDADPADWKVFQDETKSWRDQEIVEFPPWQSRGPGRQSERNRQLPGQLSGHCEAPLLLGAPGER
jgi:hypothetical protein